MNRTKQELVGLEISVVLTLFGNHFGTKLEALNHNNKKGVKQEEGALKICIRSLRISSRWEGTKRKSGQQEVLVKRRHNLLVKLEEKTYM
jgi:hypothetical protein